MDALLQKKEAQGLDQSSASMGCTGAEICPGEVKGPSRVHGDGSPVSTTTGKHGSDVVGITSGHRGLAEWPGTQTHLDGPVVPFGGSLDGGSWSCNEMP